MTTSPQTSVSREPLTKSRLLDAAERLMLARGFSATTVDEICAAAKRTKGSFFHYFDSKEALGKALLDRFCRAAHARLQAALPAREPDPLRRLHAYCEAVIAMSAECASRQGCLLGGFAQELSDTHPEIRSMCASAFTHWAATLKRELDAARAMHAPRARIDTASLAQHFIAVLEGAKLLAKAERDPAIVGRSLRHFQRYLEHLFEPA